MNLCSYTEGRATNLIKYGKCSASCWKDFFNMTPYKNSQICYGDEGTSLMAKERGRCVISSLLKKQVLMVLFCTLDTQRPGCSADACKTTLNAAKILWSTREWQLCRTGSGSMPLVSGTVQDAPSRQKFLIVSAMRTACAQGKNAPSACVQQKVIYILYFMNYHYRLYDIYLIFVYCRL